jgi:hypothetical protein
LVSGRLLLRNVAVDEDALDAELRGAVEAELRYERSEGGEIWKITWGGSQIDIPCARAEALSRGMRIIALLLRHSGTSIPYCLLEGLKRRKFELKDPSAEDAEIFRLRALIDPVCQRFLLRKTSLDAARKEIDEQLQSRDMAALPDELGFHNRAYDAVTNSLAAVKTRLRKFGGPRGPEVAAYIEKSINSKSGGFRYNPAVASVTWKWDQNRSAPKMTGSTSQSIP